ncbi:MAG: hypothetical protein VKJ85_16085, partial [Prochlorothrix sp.]|nr:hypothetical protein [Prochlorothrix sp.]
MSRYTGEVFGAMLVEGGMVADRVLQLLQEQLAGQEMALVLAPQEEKVRIQQQIAALKGEIAAREGELA